MTIQKLRVTNNGLPWGTSVVELDTNGVKLNIGAPTGVLKRNGAWYIIQGTVSNPDIKDYEIDSTKIQNEAITNVKIANNTIRSEKIEDWTITCAKLNPASFPGLSCASGPVPNGSCAPGQFLQGISTGGNFVCATPSGGTGSLPTCGNGEILISNGTTWDCAVYGSGIGTNGGSLWNTSLFNPDNIYNSNLTGKVGIGLNNPSSTLTVSGSLLVAGNGVINTGTVGTGTVDTVATLATADANAVLFVWAGKVGILTSTPQYALDVVGTIRAASYLATSDARLKTNIKVVDNALASILGINGYSYTLKTDGSNQYGVLAQEVEKFFPYLVTTDTNWYKAVNYNGLVAPLIEAIHELDAKVQAVEAKYQSNESRIQAIEAKLAK